MTPNPAIIESVEQLGYRVTVGDVAAKAGLDVNLAQQGLLVLASDSGANLQVAESGDIAYVFPKNFQAILRNKYLRLRLQEWWDKIWNVLFYLIRISFGILLLLSIVLIFLAIFIIIIALNSSNDNDSGGGGGGGSRHSGGRGGFAFFPRLWFGSDLFWIFNPSYGYSDYSRRQKRSPSSSSEKSELNFLEAIFSFLFGDGNPNIDLEERRWQAIGRLIRNNRGAVIAQQITPYLDEIDAIALEEESYMLPILSRFNGYPEVSPQGEIVYYFPELQVTAGKQEATSELTKILPEHPYRFSAAGSGQIMGAIALGSVNIIGALTLWSLMRGDIAAQIGGLVAFVASIYWLLLGYGIAFFAIPLIRYFWIQQKNAKIQQRNNQRIQRAEKLENPDTLIQQKLDYTRQFAREQIIGTEELSYSTETDLIDQELENIEKGDREWQKRLES
ncbi:hypothetical protein [Spirulina sp. 06S082]|uniref:hypothetical protein n=1 Tax=Spirulina sp. 06S082 TaxID=3110248 RepID=UPI002B205CB0|nr:hypothetical protein [Spirulina sp. 06S082]MEA5470297.1 hypothetical protein [Spirulina sp. 06S082]